MFVPLPCAFPECDETVPVGLTYCPDHAAELIELAAGYPGSEALQDALAVAAGVPVLRVVL